jgi:uncharacterized iron-regulated protein
MKRIAGPTVCLLLLALCAPAVMAQEDAQKRAEMWVDLYTGEPVAFDEVTQDLATADIVFLGERHTVDRHHRWQHEIVKALAEEDRPLVLGIEMMEKRFQPELDRYCRGEIDFEELAEATQWGEHWKNYEDYQPILEAARAAGAHILALNADSKIIRTIGRKGIDALTPEERNTLPETLNLDDPPYFALLKLQLMVHAHVDEERLHGVFAAQVARDESMAAAMADYLKSGAGKGRRAVILCGAGHCAYGYGTASRLQTRLPKAETRIVILSESGDVEIPEAMQKHVRDIEISHQQIRDAVSRPLGDYLSVIERGETVEK